MSAETSATLRVLLTNSSTIYGGGEFYVLQLARTLLSRGHAVWVSCRPDNLLVDKCNAAGVPTLPLDFPAKSQFARYIRILAGIVRRNSIQIIHSNTNYDRTVSAFAARLAGAAHVTNVHSFHSIQHNVTHRIRNRFGTDHFLVDGFCVKELLEKEDRIAGGRISVIYLGVERESMARDQQLRRELRRSLGLSEDNVVIGNVARMVPFKGHSILLRAFAAIARVSQQARLFLIGDGELYEELVRDARALGIAQQTIFAGFRDDLQAVYSSFDIYAHPSLEGGGETFPFAVLQALAQELPVVVTRVGDVPSMVEEGGNGFVVPENNPEALAKKLLLLVSDGGRRAAMGTEGLRLVRARFSLDRMVDSVERIYRDVMEKRASGTRVQRTG